MPATWDFFPLVELALESTSLDLLMSRPANKFRKCCICGNEYQYINWMIRRDMRDNTGRWLRDMHEIACAKKAGLLPTDAFARRYENAQHWRSRCGNYEVVFADRIYGSVVPPPHWKAIWHAPEPNKGMSFVLSRHSTRKAAESACRKHARENR